ncbi:MULTISPECIES: M56 family metallopeptidase [unclassified Clostridioides]|nr:protease [Clostridioides sp. ES-S-0171-01]MCC0686671.1 protease [Clostridioides sp. ES-S-0056-01]MCC0713812.1 protease [Clostridioides sp. ES-S-0077-01]UDN56369.1 protease [Clostridioides sp. ES-S-0054-01]
MNSYVFNYLINAILKTTIVSSFGICILIFLKRFYFKKFSKKFNYYIWLIIIFRMLFFVFNYSIDLYTKILQKHTIINNFNSLNINFIPKITISLVIVFTWIIVTIIYLFYSLSRYFKFKNLILDTSSNVENENIKKTYKTLLMELNIKKNIHIRHTEELESPAYMGLFESYIFLPDLAYSEDDIYWILKHELIHFKNKDILIKFLVLFVKSLFWFNPFVYIMSKRISEECELCCDESVLNNCSSKERNLYGLTLLHSIEIANLNKTDMLITEFNKSILEIRLENIKSMKKYRRGILVGILVFIISCISFLEINAQIPVAKENFNENTTNVEKQKNYGHAFTETIDYTYETAPEKYRKRYEESCKVLGEIPRKYDKIEVSTNSE